MIIKNNEEIYDLSMCKAHEIDPVAYSKGYSQAQSDLLESAGDGFKEYVAQNNGLYFGDDHRKEMDSRVWQECSLYHAKLIKEKDKIIENKSEYIFMLRKEIKERDERIKELEAKCEEFFKNNGSIIQSLEKSENKYQEAVKDIESLLFVRERLRNRLVSRRAFDVIDSVHNPIKSKYGLGKQESKV